MLTIAPEAQQYFRKLIAQQDLPELGIRMHVSQGGTSRADCHLEFCEPHEVRDGDWKLACEGFDLFVDADSAPFLTEAVITFESDPTGGQLTVKAPRLKGQPLAADADVETRIRHVIESEVNPGLASHGGRVSLEAFTESGVAVLRFGGGCHGCSMVSVTLKQGVESTLRERVPEVTAVVDATDHASGATPYFR